MKVIFTNLYKYNLKSNTQYTYVIKRFFESKLFLAAKRESGNGRAHLAVGGDGWAIQFNLEIRRRSYGNLTRC